MNNIQFSIDENEKVETEISNNKKVVQNLQMVAYRMENFKAFIDSGWIELNKTVLFLGSNSAGKTAIHQPLILLKNAYENEKKQIKVSSITELDDSRPQIKDLINKYVKHGSLSIAFKFFDDLLMEYVYKIVISEDDRQSVQVTINNVKYDITRNFFYENVFFAFDPQISLPEKVNEAVLSIMEGLRKFASAFSYMKPIRYIPERIFLFSNKSEIIGIHGEHTYSILFSLLKNGKVTNDNINKWINEFGYDLKWEPISENMGSLVLIDKKTGISTNIFDNGFGIGQSLPVIVKMATSENETILIDSPEAFLQTRMQSRIADYVIDCSNKGNKVILETSSEYLLYRIRRRIAEKKIVVSDISVYFIDSSDMFDTKCIKIPIQDNGKISRINKSFNQFFSQDFEDMNYIMLGGN